MSLRGQWLDQSVLSYFVSGGRNSHGEGWNCYWKGQSLGSSYCVNEPLKTNLEGCWKTD